MTRKPFATPLRDTLRAYLLTAVDLLRARRARDIPEKFIDSYVAMSWLEWHGGSLRLTTVGENICAQLTASLQQEMAPS